MCESRTNMCSKKYIFHCKKTENNVNHSVDSRRCKQIKSKILLLLKVRIRNNNNMLSWMPRVCNGENLNPIIKSLLYQPFIFFLIVLPGPDWLPVVDMVKIDMRHMKCHIFILLFISRTVLLICVYVFFI